MEIDGVTVKLLFFARSKELAGVRETTILLPRKISYKHLLNIISKNFNLEEIKHNILLAKNEIVCEETEDIEIKDRDSIAVGEISLMNMDHLKLTVDKLSVDDITHLVTDDSCGAVSLFIGTTRDNFEGKKVLRLEYEAYEPMAIKAMKEICDEVRDKWPTVHSIAIYHRLGKVPCREASVVIAMSSPHRRESLDAVSHCIDRLKASVPIWKKEVYETDAPTWKENVECGTRKPIQDVHLDKSLVQINVSKEELEQRIQNFIKNKREQANINNIHDFIPSKKENETEDADTCARVRTQFVRRNDSKSHLKVRKVSNEWGPQTVQHFPPTDQGDDTGLPSSIAERVLHIEKFLNIGPVPRDIYKRLKDMEDRIALLQSVSPEYAMFWKSNRGSEDNSQEKLVDYMFSAEDISRKIEQLEKMNT